MNNLEDQIKALYQCDPAVPEQNEDLMVGNHNEEAGGVKRAAWTVLGQHRIVTRSLMVSSGLAVVLPTRKTVKLIRSVS